MKPDVSAPDPIVPEAVGVAKPANGDSDDRELLARINRILSGQEPPPLMSTPPEVQPWVDRMVADRPNMTPEDRQQITDDFNLQYHHGGNEVLTWQTPQGLAVLAVGTESIARILNHLPFEERQDVWVRFPPPWG